MATSTNFSLLKGLGILNLFSDSRPEITAATVVSELGMNVATAHRFLMSLEEAGALNRLNRGTYVLGHRISELGLLAGKSNPILAIVQPVLDRLSLDLGESVSAARLLRAGITCIATAVSVQDISIHTRVGRIYEAAGTAHGQIWLAHMTDDERRAYLADLSPAGSQAKGRPNPLPDSQEFERIRNDGFCVNSGGQQEEIGGVAVPVIDAQGKIVLTLAAYCFVSRLTDEMIDRSVEKLSQAAQTISLAVSTGATGAK